MRCDEFDARLHRVLDQRKKPGDSPRLQQHARTCPRCRADLTAATRLLEGLDLLDVPPLSADFARRVVAEVVPASRTPRGTWTWLALAAAATLLVALLPSIRQAWRSTGNWTTNAATRSYATDSVAYARAPAPPSDPVAVDDSLWATYGNSILELYPEKTRARHRQQVTEFAEDLRPIATPFNTAVTAIRRTIPFGRTTGKGEPSASTDPRPANPPSHV